MNSINKTAILNILEEIDTSTSKPIDLELTELDRDVKENIAVALKFLEKKPDTDFVQQIYDQEVLNSFNKFYRQFCKKVGIKRNTQIWEFFHHMIYWYIQDREVAERNIDIMLTELKKEYYRDEEGSTDKTTYSFAENKGADQSV